MNDPAPSDAPSAERRRANWMVIALIAGVILFAAALAFFATRGNSDQDKLTGTVNSNAAAENQDRLCASKATYDALKRDLFHRAAQLRGSDQAGYDQLAGIAVLRMENPVMESENSETGAVNCSGSLSLDLPPGVAVVGGRRTLTADVDYTVQRAADGSGAVVLLRNAEPIVTPLATIAKVTQRVAEPEAEAPEVPQGEEQMNVAASESAMDIPHSPPSSYAGHPSFDCNQARSHGEVAVCSDSGLSALDVNMANQYRRALAGASPEERQVLQSTRDRFLRYRDRCPNRQCIGDAYVGRMREIREIMEGR